jgi:hypothetical protein
MKSAKLMLFGLLVFNTLVWSLFVTSFYNIPGLLAIGGMAYLFGLRHAFDADHIAAIDNTTRKLVQDGKNANSVGFFLLPWTFKRCYRVVGSSYICHKGRKKLYTHFAKHGKHSRHFHISFIFNAHRYYQHIHI